MIITEIATINERQFRRASSDEGFMIRKVGTDELYSEAVDLLDSEYVYEETDELIVEEVVENKITED